MDILFGGLIIRTIVKELELLGPILPTWSKLLVTFILSALGTWLVKIHAPADVQAQLPALGNVLSVFVLWVVTELWHIVLNALEKFAKTAK